MDPLSCHVEVKDLKGGNRNNSYVEVKDLKLEVKATAATRRSRTSNGGGI